MRRINTTNKATDLFGAGKHGWKNGVPGTADRPTEGQSEWFNAIQEEVAYVVEQSGVALDPDNNNQLITALRTMFADGTIYVDPIAAPFGAPANGVGDDTAALIAAEAAAFERGATLILRPGKTYRFNGIFSTRVSIQAQGATLRQTRASVSAGNVDATLKLAANNLTVSGLTVDCQLKSTGIAGDGVSGAVVSNCIVRNCVNLGIAFYGGSGHLVWGCKVSNVRYASVPSTGGAADPYYFGGVADSTWAFCAAEDFRRIGFVVEGNGPVKSVRVTAYRCTATNANNCDDSTTEYNAGMWAENTNSVDWLYCSISNIASGNGQASGRVVGMIPIALGNNARGTITVVGFRILTSNNYLPVSMQITGSSTYADVLIADCHLAHARTGITVSCGFNRLTIRNLTLDDIVNENGGQGGIVVDSDAGANLLNVLEIDKLSASNCTWHPNSGIVNFFSAPSACQYTVRDVKGAVPHVMRGSVAKLQAVSCEIACGATNYGSFLAVNQLHIDPQYTSRNSVNSDQIVSGAALTAGSVVAFRGGAVTGFGSGWAPEFGGVGHTLRAHGTTFSNYCWGISETGSFLNQFDHCSFLAVPPTIGAIRTNFNSPTKQVLVVQNSYFESAAAADTPIRLWNTAPTNAILQGNVRKTATNLHNLGAITSDVNNIAV